MKNNLILIALILPLLFIISGFDLINPTGIYKNLHEQIIISPADTNDFTKKLEGHYVNNNGAFLDLHSNNSCRIKLHKTVEEGKYVIDDNGNFEYMTTSGSINTAMISFKNERLIFSFEDERFEFRYKGPSKILDNESEEILNIAANHVEEYNQQLLQVSSDFYAPSMSKINN